MYVYIYMLIYLYLLTVYTIVYIICTSCLRERETLTTPNCCFYCSGVTLRVNVPHTPWASPAQPNSELCPRGALATALPPH